MSGLSPVEIQFISGSRAYGSAGDAYPSAASNVKTFSPFAISGPSRTDAANGLFPTLFSNIYQLLTDDMTAFESGWNAGY